MFFIVFWGIPSPFVPFIPLPGPGVLRLGAGYRPRPLLLLQVPAPDSQAHTTQARPGECSRSIELDSLRALQRAALLAGLEGSRRMLGGVASDP
jgi:hypothetical protein